MTSGNLPSSVIAETHVLEHPEQWLGWRALAQAVEVAAHPEAADPLATATAPAPAS
jgi:hypothetical protein